MFQLIVAVISIALVAALAIASIFYGGEAFSKSSEKANVTALINQAQQISGAYQLYRTDNGSLPADLDALSPDYLSSLPTPSKLATGSWEILAGEAVVALQATADAAGGACEEVERQAGGSGVTNPQFDCKTVDLTPVGGAADTLVFAFKL